MLTGLWYILALCGLAVVIGAGAYLVILSISIIFPSKWENRDLTEWMKKRYLAAAVTTMMSIGLLMIAAPMALIVIKALEAVAAL